MSTEHKNGYRQPVKFTNLVKAEFDENEKRFHLLVSDLEAAEVRIEVLEQEAACYKNELAKAQADEVFALGSIDHLRYKIEELEDQVSRFRKAIDSAKTKDLLAAENAYSKHKQIKSLEEENRALKKDNITLFKQVDSLKRTQLAFIDREDFVNMQIADKPLSAYGRENSNTDYWIPKNLLEDKEANWFYFYDHFQNIQRNTLKQRALIQILAAHLNRAIFDTDFKNVILAQHPTRIGEPICESIFYNQEFLGTFSLDGIKVLYYPPEQNGKAVVAIKQPEYYYLKEGEIIQEGDEAEASANWNDPARWIPVNEHSIGRAAPDPSYMSHTKYRRKTR